MKSDTPASNNVSATGLGMQAIFSLDMMVGDELQFCRAVLQSSLASVP